MRLYNQNSKFLKENAPELYKDIIVAEPLFPLQLEAVDGQENYCLQSDQARCFLHSLYDVDHEMRLMFQKTPADTKMIILFGPGYGHALDYITTHFTAVERLVIIEPSLQVFKNLLSTLDLAGFLSKINKVTLLVNKNKQETEAILESLLLENKELIFSFVYNISYRTLFQEYFTTVHTALLEALRRFHVNLGTSLVSSTKWLENMLKNLGQDSIPLETIAPYFKGRTGLIVAAGPSLNKNISLLPKVKEKAIVLAVGTAIRVLDKNAISPHFRTAMDGSEEEKTTIFDHVDTSTVPLIYGAKLYHEILPAYLGPKVLMLVSLDNIFRYLYQKATLDYLSINSEFSIATTTIDLLCRAGCSKIILVGQDLCYTAGELYAKGAREVEKIDFAVANYPKTKDIYGQEVYTTKPFLGMRDSIARYAERYPQVEFINATEGGLPIKNLQNKTLAAVLAEDLATAEPIPAMPELWTGENTNKTEYRQKIQQAMTMMSEELADVASINLKREKLLRKVKKYKERKLKPTRILKELRYAESLEKEMQTIDVYQQVIATEMKEAFTAFEISFAYNGQDKEKKADSLAKLLGGKTVEIKRYIMLLQKHLEATVTPGTVL